VSNDLSPAYRPPAPRPASFLGDNHTVALHLAKTASGGAVNFDDGAWTLTDLGNGWIVLDDGECFIRCVVEVRFACGGGMSEQDKAELAALKKEAAGQ
jgi:hypothetical protein